MFKIRKEKHWIEKYIYNYSKFKENQRKKKLQIMRDLEKNSKKKKIITSAPTIINS